IGWLAPMTRFFAIATIKEMRGRAWFIMPAFLNRYGRLDRGMRIVILEREILVLEIEQVLHGRIEPHGGELARLARQLLARLLEMVHVEVRVAERVHEIAELQTAHLRDHHRQRRV